MPLYVEWTFDRLLASHQPTPAHAVVSRPAPRRVELIVRINKMLQLNPDAQREVADGIYRELLMPAGDELRYSGPGGAASLLLHLMRERQAALTRVAEEAFHACLETAANTSMLQQLRAAAASRPARDEARTRLHNNRVRILKEICHPSPQLDIDGKSLAQCWKRVRVNAEHETIANDALREIERRLLGDGSVAFEPMTDNERDVWMAVATFLDSRIQAAPQSKPGRWPDMSANAVAMVREVLKELRGHKNHSQAARTEAGRNLRRNRARVLNDVCNPSPDKNIDGKPLTQLELNRVAPEHREFADDVLREIERRLLDEGSSSPLTIEAAQVWEAVSVYLDGRIQGTPEDKPGRTPDMSAEAAAAMREVLQELVWAVALTEAGLKLRRNRSRVLQDVCNPSSKKNIDGRPLTQLELIRVAPTHEAHAGDCSRETSL